MLLATVPVDRLFDRTDVPRSTLVHAPRGDLVYLVKEERPWACSRRYRGRDLAQTKNIAPGANGSVRVIFACHTRIHKLPPRDQMSDPESKRTNKETDEDESKIQRTSISEGVGGNFTLDV